MSPTSRGAHLAVAVSDRDHASGPPYAAVTLVEYGDFECPFCGMAYPDIKRIQSRLGDQLRFVYRHFPRPEHPHARDAAEAAEAAAAQGAQYFWSMHDQLFENQRALDDSSLLAYASRIGLDIDRFRADFTRHMYRERVHEDLESAVASGVHGTPTFFINGQRYEGRARADDLYRALLVHLDDAAPADEVDEASAEPFSASDAPGWIRERI